MNNITAVNTALGTIMAEAIPSSDYPGIKLLLVRDGVPVEFAWLEVDQSGDEDNQKPTLKIHAFDAEHDEPVCDIVIPEDKLSMLYKG